MNTRCLFLILWMTAGIPGVQGASLRIPAILGDHMVLQQKTTVNIWGWASPGNQVEVLTGWNGQTYTTLADQQGRWLTRVETDPAGGPFELTIRSDTTLVLRDILLGEVWICSGQSNMEYPMSGVQSASQSISGAQDPGIRLFTVEKHLASRPTDEVRGEWMICEPTSVRDFSAVGYFFGKNLHEALQVPVGLIHTSWGGTPSQAWTSREALRDFDFFYGELKQLDELGDPGVDLFEVTMDSLEMVIRRESDFLNPANKGFQEGWMQSEFDDSEWLDVECPSEWSTIPAIGTLEGVAWMRRRFEIPEEWVGKSLMLELGPVDEMDATYLNGRKVGSSTRAEESGNARVYRIPAPLIRGRECLLAVRIVNTIGEGGFTGMPQQLRIYPIGVDGAQPIPLSGSWKFQEACSFPRLPRMADPKGATLLYNGMIHPLRNYTIKGAIWYQGESNVSQAYLYRDLFPAMIRDWRTLWGEGDFPFYFVQIAPYAYDREFIGAELREAQFMALSRSVKTGMAVTLDIGNPNDIHPTNKRDVGARLALWALAGDYGKDVVHSGPLYREMRIEGNTIRLLFDHVGTGLVARDGQLADFEIAGPDRVYRPAMATIDGEGIVLMTPQVQSPVAVRYAWSNVPRPNLFNREGLPASSFCTDSWPRITQE